MFAGVQDDDLQGDKGIELPHLHAWLRNELKAESVADVDNFAFGNIDRDPGFQTPSLQGFSIL